MRHARWLDHLPPWLGWISLASTGAYDPIELGLMLVPLLLAFGVEAMRWDLRGWRRAMELIAVAAFAAMVLGRIGLVPIVIHTLFLLCGVRLSLPRELPQRRQLLLMGFLLHLITAIATTEMGFLLASAVWVACGGVILMNHAWEGSARFRRGPMQSPPWLRPLRWTLAVLLLAVPFFAAMPRLAVGLRPLPVGIRAFGGAQAGLSDSLDLTGRGPIEGNSEVALRLLPLAPQSPAEQQEAARAFALLRGLVLEALEGRRWSPARSDPPPAIRVAEYDALETKGSFELYLAPNRMGVLPLPYGPLSVGLPPSARFRLLYENGFRFPLRASPQPFRIRPEPGPRAWTLPDRRMYSRRRAMLLDPGEGTEPVKAWADRVAPGSPSPQELVQRLEEAFSRFSYTLSNPSGNAADPLGDFLERTQAGHCEYFASAMAIALRHRGVPSRVVNGYRLGPWIEEGGYWLVTQNEAHSWVEYFDREAGLWRVSDPTPPSPETGPMSQGFWAALQRWTDAVRFRWDRHVVRFSDEDQQAGIAWAQEHFARLRAADLPRSPWVKILLGLTLLGTVAGFLLRRGWPRRGRFSDLPAHALLPLKPLVRATAKEMPPLPGETLQRWLSRLAQRRPERQTALRVLAQEADRVAYGDAQAGALQSLVKAERAAWKQKRRT